MSDNQDIPEDSQPETTTEDVKVEDETNQEPDPEFSEYDNIEKTEVPAYEKKKGLEFINEGKYEEATKHFSKALLGFKFLVKDDIFKSAEKMEQVIKEVQIPCHLNNALCFIKLKNWAMVVEHSGQALQLLEQFANDDTAKKIKALYRKSVGYMNLQNFAKAAETIETAKSIDPDNQEVQNLAVELNNKKQKLKEKEKKMSKKLLEGLDYSEEYNKPKTEIAPEEGEKKAEEILHKVVAKTETILDKILTPLKNLCCKRREKPSVKKDKTN